MATLSKAANHSEHHHGAPSGFVKGGFILQIIKI